jgi:hypothetical protein
MAGLAYPEIRMRLSAKEAQEQGGQDLGVDLVQICIMVRHRWGDHLRLLRRVLVQVRLCQADRVRSSPRHEAQAPARARMVLAGLRRTQDLLGVRHQARMDRFHSRWAALRLSMGWALVPVLAVGLLLRTALAQALMVCRQVPAGRTCFVSRAHRAHWLGNSNGTH